METVAVLAVGDTANKVSDTSPVPVKIVDGVPVEGGNTTPVKAIETFDRGNADVYREAISAADLLAVATVTAADNAAVAGSLTAEVHTAVVSAHNVDGTSGKSTAATVTPTVDKSANLTIAQVTGATSYRIYFCLCTPDPHFLYEITEAQRTVGGVFTVNAGTVVLTPNDPATPGVFTVCAFTGAEPDSSVLTGVANTGYVLPGATPIDCTGHKYAIITVVLTPTWAVAPDCVLMPYLQNTLGTWAAGDPQDLEPLTPGNPLRQTYRLQVDSSPGVHLLCKEIAGCTAKIEVETA